MPLQVQHHLWLVVSLDISQDYRRVKNSKMSSTLPKPRKTVLEYVTKQCQRMAKQYAITKNTQFTLSFPWSRLFEVDVSLKK